MMQLNKDNLNKINAAVDISIPQESEFNLPEKILQFGTGVLLRGLPDYFICKANRRNIFNGRIILVKSTNSGDATVFAKQDNLFVHVFKDVQQDKQQETFFINAAISKVLIAKDEWKKILNCAAQTELQIIISNTTEAGIVLDETDNIHLDPPKSFPGKLLSFLHKRYTTFNGNIDSGMVIIPTELIVDNADKLKTVLIELAKINQLENDFIEWMITANDFCNSLVDRIVVSNNQTKELEFCNDELSVRSERYGLWAIETSSQNTKKMLSFSLANDEIKITNNIQKFRKLKLSLLNATHSFLCALALLFHFKFVNESMRDKVFKQFMQQLMLDEILPCVVDDEISKQEAEDFTQTVIKRFSNPYIHHDWLAIATHYPEKIKERCVPLLLKYQKRFSKLPQKMILCFAAYFVYTKTDVTKIIYDKNFWKEDSHSLPGLIEMVEFYIGKSKMANDFSALIEMNESNLK
ncbi:MAG: tagaturonate reductase [Parafilimonas sp.]